MNRREIDDILRDVIEELEPRGTLPSGMPGWSPLRLWRFNSRAPACSWAPATNVDTGTLIDAAKAAGYTVTINDDPGWHDCAVYIYRDADEAECPIGSSLNASAREAVILALAEALGVETEER